MVIPELLIGLSDESFLLNECVVFTPLELLDATNGFRGGGLGGSFGCFYK